MPLILVMSYCGLSVSWLVSSPPGSAPDEPAALVKALGAGRGQLLGSKIRYTGAADSPLETLHRQFTRALTIPAGLAIRHRIPCFAFRPDVDAGCLGEPGRPAPEGSATQLPFPESLVAMLERTAGKEGGLPGAMEERRSSYLGTYQPFVYVAPGLLAGRGGGPDSSLRLARFANAALSLALLALAIFLLFSREGGAVSILGLLVAVTPMAIFCMSTLSSSGPETAAGVAFTATLLRLARAGPPPPRAALALGISGAILALARPLGPVWVVLAAVLAVAAFGIERLRTSLRGCRGAIWSLGVVAGSAALGLAWQAIVQPTAEVAAHRLPRFFVNSVVDLPATFRQQIGLFGWLETRLPFAAYQAWTLTVLALLGLGVLAGQRRQRAVLVLAIAGAICVIVAVATFVAWPLGGSIQGRWVLPILVSVPLLSGEVVWLNRARFSDLPLGHVALLVAAIAALVHAVAFWANSRRYAVGADGPIMFLGRSEWHPPLGWLPWVALTFVSCLGLTVAAGLANRLDTR